MFNDNERNINFGDVLLEDIYSFFFIFQDIKAQKLKIKIKIKLWCVFLTHNKINFVNAKDTDAFSTIKNFARYKSRLKNRYYRKIRRNQEKRTIIKKGRKCMLYNN